MKIVMKITPTIAKRLQHSLQHDTLADVIERLKQLERSRSEEHTSELQSR